jgi:hypothetical protein
MERIVISNGGGFSTTGGYLLEYSFGEPVIQSFENTNISLTQGFHQPTLIVSGIDKDILSDILIYPNPVRNSIKIKLPASYSEDFYYSLFDINGKLLKYGELLKGENAIDMSIYAIGSYILRITGKSSMKEQEAKIIKIK